MTWEEDPTTRRAPDWMRNRLDLKVLSVVKTAPETMLTEPLVPTMLTGPVMRAEPPLRLSAVLLARIPPRMWPALLSVPSAPRLDSMAFVSAPEPACITAPASLFSTLIVPVLYTPRVPGSDPGTMRPRFVIWVIVPWFQIPSDAPPTMEPSLVI